MHHVEAAVELHNQVHGGRDLRLLGHIATGVVDRGGGPLGRLSSAATWRPRSSWTSVRMSLIPCRTNSADVAPPVISATFPASLSTDERKETSMGVQCSGIQDEGFQEVASAS